MTEKVAGRGAIGVVPTLQLERDALPTACAGCGSRALIPHEPYGGALVGELACYRCGGIAAYLKPAPPRIGSLRPKLVPDDALPPKEPRPMVRVVERAVGFERTADCTAACGPTTGHMPYVHREAGVRATYAEIAASGMAIVRTGPLAVDLAGRIVWVDGHTVPLFGRGCDVLVALAEAAGRALAWRELVERIWPRRVGEGDKAHGPYHWLSVVVVRLRQRLGPDAARLVVTAPAFGYRLAMVDYTGPTELDVPLATVGPYAWARGFEACRGCRTTERPHKAYGLCWRCYERDRRRRKDARA